MAAAASGLLPIVLISCAYYVDTARVFADLHARKTESSNDPIEL